MTLGYFDKMYGTFLLRGTFTIKLQKHKSTDLNIKSFKLLQTLYCILLNTKSSTITKSNAKTIQNLANLKAVFF